jgi:hypothetical protein
MVLSCSWSINVDIKWRVLNLGLKSNKAYYEIFINIFLKKKLKNLKPQHLHFYFWKPNTITQKQYMHFFWIKLSKSAKLFLFLNFKLTNMTKFDASFNNQWPNKLIQSTNRYNSAKEINNLLRCVSRQWKWYSWSSSHYFSCYKII